MTFNDSFSYDYRGRVSSTIRTIAGTPYTLSTSYHLLDRPLALTYPGGEVVTTGYDKQVANSLSTNAGPTTFVSDVTYNHRLEMTGMVLGNNLTQSYVYFGATENYRLDKALLKVNGGSNIYYREYEYDDVGNITQFITSVAGQVQEEQIFTYDSLGRLKTAKALEGPAPYDHSSASTDYEYDAIGNIMSLAGSSDYKYAEWNGGCGASNPPQALPHAVKKIGNNYYCYDKNGNMTKRVEGSTTYTQAFDVENRLITVSLGGTNPVTTFAYDASGQRLRTAVAPAGSPAANDTRTFTTYPFPGYEVEQTDTWQYLCTGDRGGECSWQWGQTSTVTRKTYFLGGQAVATRVVSSPAQSGDGFYYLHTDHLGSSSLLTNSSGVKVTGSETRYYPYGAQRLAPTMPSDNITDRDFTGQKENLELGLIYYNARYYVPYLNRFISADSIIPQPSNPQSYNRYSYALNNPIRYTDPSGHCAVDDEFRKQCSDKQPIALVQFDGDGWSLKEKVEVWKGAMIVANALHEASGGEFGSPTETFLAAYGGSVTFAQSTETCQEALSHNCWASAGRHQVTVYSNAGTIDAWVASHELGHSFNANIKLTDDDFWGERYKNLAQEGVYARDGTFLAGNTNPVSYSDNDTYIRTGLGYQGTDKDHYPWRQNTDSFVEEDYADMFMNYVNNSFANNDYGTDRYAWMDSHMHSWISLAVSNNQ